MWHRSTVCQDEGQNSERRSARRAALDWVVLVYFGTDNWGKLINLSERGMRFEFAHPPAEREEIRFKLEAMGRAPGSGDGVIVREAFEAAGDIRWTRDFERTAGVLFVDLGEESREQIRKWLSLEVSAITRPAEEKPPIPAGESFELAESSAETLPAIYAEEAPDPEGHGEVIAEEESAQAKSAGTPNMRLSRTLIMPLAVGLAGVVMIGGLRITLPRLARGIAAAQGVPRSAASAGESVSPKNSATTGDRRPFVVEVLDAGNRQSLLRFDDGDSENGPTLVNYKSSLPVSTASVKTAGRPNQSSPSTSQKLSTPLTFTPLAPKVSSPEAASSGASLPSLAAPLVHEELKSSLEAPVAAIPEPLPLAVGGEVQAARLVKSIPPVYPQMAQTNRIGGDVSLDALIDAKGNVTELKFKSGPLILGRAAMDAVRQWKYDPARLNGRPVPMHLDVKVKFDVE